METVLVVDDILMNRILLGEIVMQLGYKVEYAENGKIAIDILRSTYIPYVLMDVEMPVMTGIEATQKIKADYKLHKIKIVGVTAHLPSSFFKDYADVKFDEFITKPYTIERVGSVLKSLKNIS